MYTNLPEQICPMSHVPQFAKVLCYYERRVVKAHKRCQLSNNLKAQTNWIFWILYMFFSFHASESNPTPLYVSNNTNSKAAVCKLTIQFNSARYTIHSIKLPRVKHIWGSVHSHCCLNGVWVWLAILDFRRLLFLLIIIIIVIYVQPSKISRIVHTLFKHFLIKSMKWWLITSFSLKKQYFILIKVSSLTIHTVNVCGPTFFTSTWHVSQLLFIWNTDTTNKNSPSKLALFWLIYFEGQKRNAKLKKIKKS